MRVYKILQKFREKQGQFDELFGKLIVENEKIMCKREGKKCKGKQGKKFKFFE